MAKSDASAGNGQFAARKRATASAEGLTIGRTPKPATARTSQSERPPPNENRRHPAGYDPPIHAPLGISPEDWADVSDNPPVTEDELAAMRPFVEVFPALAAKMRHGPGRPALEKPKRQVTIRLDDEVVEAFRRDGKGWQARINTALRKAAGL